MNRSSELKTNSERPVKALALLVTGLSRRRQRQLAALAVLMVISAFCEVLTISAVLPFLSLLTAPDNLVGRGWFGEMIRQLGGTGIEDLRWRLTLVFVAAAALAGCIRMTLNYTVAKLYSRIGLDIGAVVFRRTIEQPYEVHTNRNSSDVVAAIHKLDGAVAIIQTALNCASAAITALFITVTLLLLDPYIAIASFFGLGGTYAALAFFSRKELEKCSTISNTAYNARIKCVQEALGSIRDVLLWHTQDYYMNQFSAADRKLRDAMATTQIIGPAPRFIVESAGMILLAGLGYWATRGGGGIIEALPTLGALAIGLQRLMPLLQQVYQGFVTLGYHQMALSELICLLQQPQPETPVPRNCLSFEREIRFDDVSFSYKPNTVNAISNISFTIRKGARVGIIGVTGSGKSTVADLIMGLLEPETGQITVDNAPLVGSSRLAWQRNIAHVPQMIYLSDASFAENIAFGVPPGEIEMERVRSAAREAQLADFIEGQPEKYASIVGERGIRLSGGQRQRIAIARALFRGATVLVFDEATSALDEGTEAAVMGALQSLGRDLTMIIIAHRLRTLRNCDGIVRLDKGHLAEVGTYDEVVRNERADWTRQHPTRSRERALARLDRP